MTGFCREFDSIFSKAKCESSNKVNSNKLFEHCFKIIGEINSLANCKRGYGGIKSNGNHSKQNEFIFVIF